MGETLVKFKHIEDISDNTSFIEAMWTTDPLTVLQLARESGSVILNGESYDYGFSELIPTVDKGLVNVLMIYVENY